MKARVKATGEIVDVKCLDNNNWYDKLYDIYYLSSELDFEYIYEDLPSKLRMRYELTKIAMQSILMRDFYKRHPIPIVELSGEAIKIADEIIKQLKEK